MGITQTVESIGSEITIRIGEIYNTITASEDKTIAFLLSVVILTFYVYVLVLFYSRLSKRDMFTVHLEDKHGLGKVFEIGSYILKNLVLFPIYVVFWFLFVSYTLIFLSSVNFEHILLVAALVLATIRGLAYLDEAASIEMAKLLPLTFVAAVLLDPAMLERQPFPSEQIIRETFVPLVVFYLKLIIGFEIALRLVYDIFIFFGYRNSSQKKEDNTRRR